MEFTINYISIILAAAAGMVIGMAWYSKFLFGNAWLQLIGLSEDELKKAQANGMGKTFALAIVMQLLMAGVLSFLVHLTETVGNTGLKGALGIAFLIWLGFVATLMLNSVLWESKPWKLYFINVSYPLVSLLVMAAIVSF